MQKNVAVLLETNITSIRNWENNRCEPNLQAIPKIINFIGFCPYDANLPISQKLRLRREINGIPQKDMALLIGVDQSTLAGWEQGKRIPSFKQNQRIQAAMVIIGELIQRRVTESQPNKFLLSRKFPKK
jgi:DNA-binding XRE family transcriptional regulator